MKKKIAVFGTGYVGLVTAVGLADIGHDVFAVDIDRTRVKDLKKGYLPFYEPGLKKIMKTVITAGKIHFSSESDKAVNRSDVIFIAVGTPPLEDGRADLSQLRNAVDCVIEDLDSSKVIIIKSTVPPGTIDALKELHSAELESTKSEIVFCPEFLREGTAVHDFYHPDRLVIGSDSDTAARIVDDIFFPVVGKRDVPVLKCSPVSAEMIKYSSNVMLAARIAVMNELAEMSETVGSDIIEIAAGVGLDSRIGNSFLNAGPGFGGSCFGKDVSGLVTAAAARGVELGLIREILTSNDKQRLRPALRLEKAVGSLRGKKIAVLGLAFKAETDDVRGSAAFDVIEYLTEKGAQVKAHDPLAEYNFIRDFKKKGYSCTELVEDALKKADAAIILTEWKEYRNLSPECLAGCMKGRVIIDSRNIIDVNAFRSEGFTVFGTGMVEVKPKLKSRNRSDFMNAAIVSM
ncbi:MAG: UDP-glucose/GDP-mannose dehydrogenase family protein [Spirochaetales bacterium]|uniref:UDP-glucose 6-dehydrogenase n=1 Tax=Candidatus Thalassospirochaeta sargassi TaxID=3119039 RepID=A0AAJ1MKB1_9SPIO|nr:UDP-glucose/GDP-mannose dehydrogenase family protein [Spirochaetales bacterium]